MGILWVFGGFAKFTKNDVSFVMSVSVSACPYVRMEQIDSHCTEIETSLTL